MDPLEIQRLDDVEFSDEGERNRALIALARLRTVMKEKADLEAELKDIIQNQATETRTALFEALNQIQATEKDPGISEVEVRAIGQDVLGELDQDDLAGLLDEE